MPLIIVVAGIVVLLLLMTIFKLNAFFSLLITAFLIAILNSMGINDAVSSILQGMGDTLGSLVLILTFGAMLGKLIEESGAALTIAHKLNKVLGRKYIQLAVVITGFLIGLPMIYNASFLVLIPLVYTFSTALKLPLLYLGIPLSASLSVAHGYLPPHPAPTAISIIYGADVNQVLLYGLIPCIPAIFLAGIVLSHFFKKLDVHPPKELFTYKKIKQEDLPPLSVSLFTTLSPVVLMLVGALVSLFCDEGEDTVILSLAEFVGNPNVALFIAVLIGMYTFGVRRRKETKDVMRSLEKSVAGIALILLIIAGGGALKQVLFDSGVATYIEGLATGMNVNPILMAWLLAAFLRLAVGSATVATITAAGIMHPIVAVSSVSPELMVLATGSGSLMFSHFNDIGFWMFKEYYNVSIKQTFQTWTVMECIIGVVGLGTVFLLDMIL